MALPLILGAAGGAMKVIGAVGKKNEAQRQLDSQRVFAQQQRSAFDAGYGDLLAQAKSAPTYQADISRFEKIEQQADLAKRMASGMSRGAGEQIARDQAAQTSANALAAASRGAGSGTDIMTAALLAQQGENQAQNVISARSAQEQVDMQNRAQQNQLAALGQTAAASLRERGLEFSSLANKQANIMGVTQNRLQGELGLNQQLFEGEQARSAALADARSAIYSGIGDIASGLGTGIMGIQNQKANMDMLSKIYGNNKNLGGDVLSPTQLFARNTIGTGTNLAQMINPSFGQMQQFKSPNRLPTPPAPISPNYTTANDGLYNQVLPFFN